MRRATAVLSIAPTLGAVDGAHQLVAAIARRLGTIAIEVRWRDANGRFHHPYQECGDASCRGLGITTGRDD